MPGVSSLISDMLVRYNVVVGTFMVSYFDGPHQRNLQTGSTRLFQNGSNPREPERVMEIILKSLGYLSQDILPPQNALSNAILDIYHTLPLPDNLDCIILDGLNIWSCMNYATPLYRTTRPSTFAEDRPPFCLIRTLLKINPCNPIPNSDPA